MAKSKAWTEAFTGRGLTILSSAPPDSTPRLSVLTDGKGVVVGTLFETGYEEHGPQLRLDQETTDRVVVSGGQELLSRFWGHYVAFIQDPDARLTHILRDPCGATPCFYTHVNGVDVLCSFVDDIAELNGVRFSINWDSVRAYFLSNHFINTRTGLSELTELLPGQRLTWRSSNRPVTSSLWNPVAIGGAPNLQSYEATREDFRIVTERCVGAWARAGGSVLVRMSGGLDSSIVAGLVRRASENGVLGVHFVNRGYEAFELGLAREASAHAGIQLVEQTFDRATISFRAAASGPRLARPTKQLLGTDADAKLIEICKITGAQTVMGGHGGDSIFLQRSIAGDALTDYLRIKGLGRDIWRVAYDTAVLLESSIWHVGKDAALKVIRGRRWNADTLLEDAKVSPHQLLTQESIASTSPESLTSMWLAEATDLPNGKSEQLRNILALRNYHPARGHALAHNAVHPLISQPLVELALRTPTYLFSFGGADRALERDAFRDCIPASVARRYNKGFVNHSVIASVVDDLDYIREFVLGGSCVRSGLLDCRKVERLVTSEQLLQGQGIGALMDLVAVESWLAPWNA
ncbi:MAG: asparagine synthase-related protein [Hyphomonadaceae bacterium]|nr:asparagine synthase-related protein [Hyphomonadaceae bacterium]